MLRLFLASVGIYFHLFLFSIYLSLYYCKCKTVVSRAVDIPGVPRIYLEYLRANIILVRDHPLFLSFYDFSTFESVDSGGRELRFKCEGIQASPDGHSKNDHFF